MSNNQVNFVFQDFAFDSKLDKASLIREYMFSMLSMSNKIFIYKNLPDTIKSEDVEYYLQTMGFCVFAKAEAKDIGPKRKPGLYAFFGGLGGIPNAYYKPTKAIVANPYLGLNKIYEINEECALIKNDYFYHGLKGVFNKYAVLLAETDISMRFGAINSRILSLISADDDRTKESAEQVLEDIEEGKKLGVIGSNAFTQGIKTSDYSLKNSDSVKVIIELHQYLLSHWFMELGINSSFNMKRESLNDSETSMNDDTLVPNIYQMLDNRKKGVEDVNRIFGTDIEVEFSPLWARIFSSITDEDLNKFNDSKEQAEKLAEENVDNKSIENKDENKDEKKDENKGEKKGAKQDD